MRGSLAAQVTARGKTDGENSIYIEFFFALIIYSIFITAIGAIVSTAIEGLKNYIIKINIK